jgi:hypothetical protein
MYLYFSLLYLGVIIVDITYVEILVGMLLCVGMWSLKPNYFFGVYAFLGLVIIIVIAFKQ